MNSYTLELENDQLLNIIPLVAFLKNNEGQDIEITVNQESHCLTWNRVYDLLDQFDFTSVSIITSNALECHKKYHVDNRFWFYWFFQGISQTSNFDHNFDYSWNRSKTFGCFYGRPSASRLGIASYLHTRFPSQSLIKIRFDNTHEGSRKHFELQKLYSWAPDQIVDVSNLLKNIDQYSSEFHAYDYTTFKYDYSNKLNYLYKNIFVDLIVEAHFQGDSFYPTEKIVRAMLCRKPFIVMAPVNYLKYLKQMGFYTFSAVWNESYDDLGAKSRYFAILELIDNIGNRSQSELSELNNRILPIVEHNYQLLISDKFAKSVTKIQ